MAKRNHMIMIHLGHCMAFLTVIAAYMLGYQYVEARKIASVKNMELVKHKGTVKTIKSEDGDVIDCVDIYKQPAFDHPLLKNHTIEMQPSFDPEGIKPINSQTKIVQSWQRNGQCPEGTVPIRRTHQQDYRRVIPFPWHIKHLNQSKREFSPHEYAVVSQSGDAYYGAYAKLNVWNPKTEISDELSLAQIWLLSGKEETINTIEAGWIVYPEYFHDNRTRLFIYWTRDNYQTTGCYNFDCPGFVQISKNFYIGGPVTRVSGYGRDQFETAITIYKNTVSGNWWLRVQDRVIGYWPGPIFTSLANAAAEVNWGGEVINKKSMGHHTSTQMGSGHFPSEGPGKSSYVSNLGVMDQSGKVRNAEKLDTYVSRSECYDIHVTENSKTESGTYFYYGGPGFSGRCIW